MKTTARFDSLPVYLLATIPQKKRDLIASGVDVIDLGAGDADLAAPPAAVQAMIAAVQEPGMSRYGFGLGLPKYREAVSAWMEQRFGHRFDPLKEIVPLIVPPVVASRWSSCPWIGLLRPSSASNSRPDTMPDPIFAGSMFARGAISSLLTAPS